ncbi:hypothetical protein ZWY2020_033152 [Hordeum vulgare]|nr:hypothetical protein ZWY2020_033152 [Hordeum vulgare]
MAQPEAALDKIEASLSKFDDGPFFLGHFSLVDIAYAPFVDGFQDFSVDPLLPPLSARPEHVERALKARYRDAMNVLKPLGRELDLLVAIFPDNNGSLYENLSFPLRDQLVKKPRGSYSTGMLLVKDSSIRFCCMSLMRLEM